MRFPLALLSLAALSGCTLPWPATPAPSPTGAPETIVPPLSAAAPPCANLTIVLDRDVLRAGENVTIVVTLANCGGADLVVRPGGECYQGSNLDVVLDEDHAGEYAFTGPDSGLPSPTEAPPQQRGRPVVCWMPLGPAPIAFIVRPGGNASATLSWNGSAYRRVSVLSERGSESHDELQPLPAGRVALSASFALGDGRAATAGADLTLALPPRNATRLLVVDEWDWRNETRAMIPAPSFPPCDEATLEDGALRVHGGRPVDDHALLRRYHGAGSTAAYEAWSPDGGILLGPATTDETLAAVAPSGPDLWVVPHGSGPWENDAGLTPGNETTLRETGSFYEHALVLRNAGLVPVVVDDVACAQP